MTTQGVRARVQALFRRAQPPSSKMPARVVAFVLTAGLLVAGCGSSTSSAPPVAATTTSKSPTRSARTTTSAAPSALQAEANSAATGDIPDNQVFIGFHDPAAGYSMKYPEGWAQRGTDARVTFRDKNNIVRVVVTHATPSAATVNADLQRLAGAHLQSGPGRQTISGAPAFKVVYTTASTPNAVTGKRVTLLVDRYYLWHAGKEAIVDLGTPIGVDNVDAYRLMIESFRWR
jgi:hypothetical protein